MTEIRRGIESGLAARALKKIKVRQPLQFFTINTKMKFNPDHLSQYTEIVQEELNVKSAKINSGNFMTMVTLLDDNITPELKKEGIARELIRQIQNTRKKAGFNVEDRIQLTIGTDSTAITEAYTKFKDMIWTETLTTGPLEGNPEYSEKVKLGGEGVDISLKRAGDRV